MSVVCYVFEDPRTSVEILQLSLEYGSQDAAAQALLEQLNERPDVTAVEFITPTESANMPRFCRLVETAPKHIKMFGGGALSSDADFDDVLVFSSAGAPSDHDIVAILYSGPALHVQTQLIQGWKPLGMPMRITKAERKNLHELNGRPALELYDHYLHISGDDHFQQNGLCFPIYVESDGMQLLRTPIGLNPDGSIALPTDITDVDAECRFAYGDPLAISENIQECLARIRAFQPQAILSIACISRLLYWGARFAPYEMRPFRRVASMAGFYSGGEMIRIDGKLAYQNLSYVLVGMREGEPDPDAVLAHVENPAPMAMNLQLSIIGHMASFIGAASRELEQANEELRKAYDAMHAMARTDGLTGLPNRREVERAMDEAVEAFARPAEAAATGESCDAVSVIMLDLDDFKHVNDTFGHEVGDEVLRGLAACIRENVCEACPQATAGRWGGEEFMAVLPNADAPTAHSMAEGLRACFAEREFGPAGRRTMSIGVAQLRPGENADRLCSRVDDALYRAKAQGKNRTELAD
jgi:diguanylate cyclase (GGDEF)-like protein